MDFRQLEYFVVTARAGNFTKAAKTFYISRQALRKAITNLESEIGAQLFKVKSQGLELTDTGQLLLYEALPLVDSYHQLQMRFSRTHNLQNPQLSLSLCVVAGAFFTFQPNLLETFIDEHPEILVTIEECNTATATDLVRTQDADVGFVGAIPRYLEDFDYKLIRHTGVYIFVPRTSPLSKQDHLTVKDIDKQPFVTQGRHDFLHRFLVEACTQEGVMVDIIFSSSNDKLLINQAIRSQAMFFGFPQSILTLATPYEGQFKLLPLMAPHADEFGTYAIVKKGTRLNTAMTEFWNYLDKAIR